MDAVTRTPVPVNETVRMYAPGSPERTSLEARLVEMAGSHYELTATIGGEQRFGHGEEMDVVQPHARHHVLGTMRGSTHRDAEEGDGPGCLDVTDAVMVHDLDDRSLLHAVRGALADADEAFLCVAFVQEKGIHLVEKELEERRGMMGEMLAEMTALEEERDQSVRRAQALSALDEERQKLADELSRRGEELEAALSGTRAEAGRLTVELDERTTDGARLRAGLSETVRERDALARELAAVRSERDELLEARRALEKIHEALSQARSRLG